MSSFKGSSIEDLRLAAQYLKIHVKDYQGLGIESLLNARDPLLLHVASSGQLIAYNHWVLFLGIENGQARILDTRNGVRLVPLGKLCARWDGIALAAHLDEQPQVNYGQIELRSSFLYVLAAAGVVLLGTVAAQFLFRGFWLGVSVFVIGTTVLAGYGSFKDYSATRCVEANDYLYAVLQEKNFDVVTKEQLTQLLTDQEQPITLIDARRNRSFILGSIPGAINLPVDIAEADLEANLEGIPRSKSASSDTSCSQTRPLNLLPSSCHSSNWCLVSTC